MTKPRTNTCTTIDQNNEPFVRAVIYCRVSSAAQVAKGHGMASQETRCREFAERNGYEVAATFRDEAVSGGIFDRPGMQDMLAFLRKNRKRGGTVVIIDDISRLARDIKAHLDLRDAISGAGGRLESPSIEFGEDSDSLLVENLLASVSQHQRQKNAEQVHNRQRARLLNGYWTFSCPPGYRYVKAPGQGMILERAEPLASIIAEGLEGFASDRFQTKSEVKRFFESFPDFPKTRYGTVTCENTNRILTRLLYAGYLERPQWGVPLRQARHEPLISLETFQKIQQRIEEGARIPARADISEDFPLRGFVCCAECGKPLTSCWSRSKTGKKHPYYQCYNRECDLFQKSIRRDDLERDFVALLATLQPSASLKTLAEEMFRRAWDQQGMRMKELRRSVRDKIAEIEKQTAALLDRIVEASNPSVIARYEQRIEALELERQVMLEKLEEKRRKKRPFEEVFKLALQFLSSPCKIWENGSIEQRHAVLKLAFNRRPCYRKNEGFLNPESSFIFKVLGGVLGHEKNLAERVGFEPTIRF
ncbi:MAG: recombinase family protein [Rhodospirillaceae bacterium]